MTSPARGVFAGMSGVLFAYAAMAFPDAIGVVAERLRLGSASSSLVFVWFALLSLPAGVMCGRFGARRVAAASLLASLPALALMALGGSGSTAAAAGLALMGACNVVLQVAMPSRVAEVWGAGRQASVMTLGLFAKMVCAICLPFLLAALAAAGSWRLFFPAFGVVFAVGAALLMRSGGDGIRPSCGDATPASVLAVATDVPTLLAVAAFAVGVVADVSFNLSVPWAVRMRFGLGDSAVGGVYAILFGVKLPVTLLGAWSFARFDCRLTFPASVALGFAGALLFANASLFPLYLLGVALFAAGYANVYGFVFAAAAPRHPPGRSAAVSAFLVMAIAGGALASPLVAAISRHVSSPAEFLAVAATAALLVLSAASATAKEVRRHEEGR